MSKQQQQVKRCSKCLNVKPFFEFGRDIHNPTGTHSHCYECRREQDRERNAQPQRQIYNQVSHANTRARKMGVMGTLTYDDIMQKIYDQCGLCYWCSQRLDDDFEIDHVHPMGTGYDNGDNTPDNVVCTCPRCNREKGDKPLNVWLGVLASWGIVHPDYDDGQPYQPELFRV